MPFPAYPAARAVARRVHPYYASHLEGNSELLPGVETIEAIVDAGFWASLRREENYNPRISLAFVAHTELSLPLVFERPVPLASESLTRLGPAVERPGIHLCVCRQQDDLVVWGAARSLPRFCFVLEVVAPGLLIIKHSRGGDSGKFVNIAVLQGDEIKVIDQVSARAYEGDSPDSVNVLMQFAVSMRAHGRGGTLLVVPASTQTWRESILHPITYSVSPAFGALLHLMKEDAHERSDRRWQEALRRLVAGLAGLTAVDGATIITEHYELLAFGAKIIRPRGRILVGAVVVNEPIEGIDPVIAEPGQLGGTRHLSGAQFAQDQRDSIALVASQDGRFTMFAWSPRDEMVCAHRIETLLL
jgi:hypothetical protein